MNAAAPASVGARSTASGASATVTLARPASEGVGGWRLQAWARASDLANSSVAVSANRATTTPANIEYSTPATGYGANAAVQGRWGAATWELGADARATDGTEHERFRVVNNLYVMGRDAGGKTFVGGVYLETAYDQGPWVATGGVRVDHWSSSNAQRHEYVLATGVTTLNAPAADCRRHTADLAASACATASRLRSGSGPRPTPVSARRR
jgi:hypothetical protein